MWVYLNDRLVPLEDAVVPVTDRGFLYGDSVFETMAAYSGAVFRYQEHLDRFVAGAAELGIALPFAPETLQERLQAVLRRNAVGDAILRMMLTRGTGPRGLGIGGCRSPTFIILCYPPPAPPVHLRETGATMVVARTRRTPSVAVPSFTKHGNYLNNILAFREAAEVQADEALMLTPSSHIVEGTVSNIFFVARGSLLTPSLQCGAVPGVTRKVVLELAASLGITHREMQLSAELLGSFNEVFYTNTGVGVMPVKRIGDTRYPAPGPVTCLLSEALAGLIAREAGPAWNAGLLVPQPSATVAAECLKVQAS